MPCQTTCDIPECSACLVHDLRGVYRQDRTSYFIALRARLPTCFQVPDALRTSLILDARHVPAEYSRPILHALGLDFPARTGILCTCDLFKHPHDSCFHQLFVFSILFYALRCHETTDQRSTTDDRRTTTYVCHQSDPITFKKISSQFLFWK